jgi:carboxymethylenebutenolidase
MSGALMIDSGDGGRFSAYLARPSAAKALGVVMLQEIFGVTPSLRAMADRFARQGFLVAVPDLFWRIQPEVELQYSGADRQKAHDYLARFDTDLGVADVGATVNALRQMAECDGRIAVAGYCLGGTLAYLSACRLEISGAASYYGTDIHNRLDEARKLKCPLLLHFAENDHLMQDEDVERIGAALKGLPATLHVYPDVGHAFCRDAEAKERHVRSQADKANARTFDFLGRLT